MKNQRIYFENQEIENIAEIFCRGIFYGDGFFETMRWKRRPPVFLKRHIARAFHAASVLRIPGFDGEKITAEIFRAVEKSGCKDCAVKLCVVSGGSPNPFYREPDSCKVLVSIKEIEEDLSGKPIKIIFSQSGYLKSPSPVSSVKSLNYLENIVAMREAKQSGFDDAVFCTTSGCVAETTCRNIFWGSGRTVYTPHTDCGILPGLTREVLMRIAKEEGFSVSESFFKPEHLHGADFVFATNSLSGINPVEKIRFQDLTLNFSTSVHQSYQGLKSLLLQSLMWL